MAFQYSSIENNKTSKITTDEATPIGRAEEPQFYYDVDSRFIKTVTKSNLTQAETVFELFTENEIEGIESLRDVKIRIVTEGHGRYVKGKANTLNSAQKELFNSIDYSTNFCIEAFSKKRIPNSSVVVEYCFVYYITVIPEKEALYQNGQAALLHYLKENSKEEIADVTKDKLTSGKVRFTISKTGEITSTVLESTSGYDSIDDKMISLIKNLPGKWHPASNSIGENVDQELVFSFGTIGC